jgi:hypothetical protein
MYTTTRGTQWQLTPANWRKIRQCAAKRFDGSGALFNACWRQYRAYLVGSIDDPENIGDVMSWLDTLAAERVNNSKSRFYITG